MGRADRPVSFFIGVDTGGTFTDCVVVDDNGRVTVAKAASTPPGFAQGVMEIVMRHAPDFDPKSMEMRPSSKGKYLGITVTIVAQSREQLDALYRDLCDHPSVVMVL